MMGLKPFFSQEHTLIIKYNILETGHENYQQPIFANHVKLLDCCRIQIDKWVY